METEAERALLTTRQRRLAEAARALSTRVTLGGSAILVLLIGAAAS